MFRSLLNWLFDPLIIFGSIVFSMLMFGAILLILLNTRSTHNPSIIPTVQLNIILAPTYTPTQIPEIVENTPEIGDNNATQTVGKYQMAVGYYVQVTGTEGDGLRLRSEPGLEKPVKYLASEGQVFEILDGPNEASGYLWWYLVAPMDQTVNGWAVEDFIQIIRNPEE